MPAGLTVFNAGGTIQVDSTYKNFALVRKAYVTQQDGAPWPLEPSLYSYSIDMAATQPLIAIRPDLTTLNVGGFPTADVCARAWTVIDLGGGVKRINFRYRGAFTYYVFDEPSPNAASYGLEVFNASGVLCFSSGRKYMRVVGPYTDSPPATEPAGRAYAMLQCRPAVGISTDSPIDEPSVFGVVYQDEFVIRSVNGYRPLLVQNEFSGYVYNFGNYVPPSASFGAGFSLILDVTGY